jgi:hypothetical protein
MLYHNAHMATGKAQGRQDAISLMAAWRGACDELRRDAVALRLAEVAAEGGPAAVEQAALGLSDVAGMFIELYADSAGASLDTVLEEAAAALRDSGDPDMALPDA